MPKRKPQATIPLRDYVDQRFADLDRTIRDTRDALRERTTLLATLIGLGLTLLVALGFHFRP